MRRASLRRGQPVPERGEPSVMSTMHASPPFINDTNANQFREMCWGCGSARAVLVVEREADTTVINGLWCWLCSRAIHQDCLSEDNLATLGCRHDDCPLFPPGRLA